MKTFAVLALASLSFVTLTANAAKGTALDASVVQYQYGMELDVAKVISTSDVSRICGVTRSVMVYEDHQGERHSLSYLEMGGGCADK